MYQSCTICSYHHCIQQIISTIWNSRTRVGQDGQIVGIPQQWVRQQVLGMCQPHEITGRNFKESLKDDEGSLKPAQNIPKTTWIIANVLLCRIRLPYLQVSAEPTLSPEAYNRLMSWMGYKKHAVCTDHGKKIFIPVIPAILMKKGAYNQPKRLERFWKWLGSVGLKNWDLQ